MLVHPQLNVHYYLETYLNIHLTNARYLGIIFSIDLSLVTNARYKLLARF